MLHDHHCSFKITHRGKQYEKFQCTNYIDTTNLSRNLPKLNIYLSRDISAANLYVTNIAKLSIYLILLENMIYVYAFFSLSNLFKLASLNFKDFKNTYFIAIFNI